MILVGDLVIYGLGYKFGESIVSLKPFSYIFTQPRLIKAKSSITGMAKASALSAASLPDSGPGYTFSPVSHG